MDLPTYIQSLGIDEFASLFGVSTHTAKSWMYRARRPRQKKAAEIVERTKGRVSFAGIYGEDRPQ